MLPAPLAATAAAVACHRCHGKQCPAGHDESVVTAYAAPPEHRPGEWREYMYSQTCLRRPLKGPSKRGLSYQVVSLSRFIRPEIASSWSLFQMSSRTGDRLIRVVALTAFTLESSRGQGNQIRQPKGPSGIIDNFHETKKFSLTA